VIDVLDIVPAFTYFRVIDDSTTENSKLLNIISSIRGNIDFAFVDASYCVYLKQKHYNDGGKCKKLQFTRIFS